MRTWRLRLDLLDIRRRLLQEAKSLGQLHDEEYIRTAKLLDSLVNDPAYLSWATLFAFVLCPIERPQRARTPNPDLRKAIDKSDKELVGRFVGHLLHETLTGLLLRACIPAIVRMRAKKRVETEVKEYLKEVEEASWYTGLRGNLLAAH